MKFIQFVKNIIRQHRLHAIMHDINIEPESDNLKTIIRQINDGIIIPTVMSNEEHEIFVSYSFLGGTLVFTSDLKTPRIVGKNITASNRNFTDNDVKLIQAMSLKYMIEDQQRRKELMTKFGASHDLFAKKRSGSTW